MKDFYWGVSAKFSRFFYTRSAALLTIVGALFGARSALAQRPLGIDVSHYQDTINWTNVAGSGIAFAVSKGTEGLTYTDPTFVSNVLHAKAVGIPIGLYHFAHPETHLGLAGADAEAAFFWSVVSNYVKGDGLSLMPALDYETAPGSSYTAATSSAWVNQWCQDVVNFGRSNGVIVTPIVYTYTSFTSSWLDNSATNWPLWMASPNGRNPQTGAPSRTQPWPTWQFWQYGGVTVPGIANGAVDADVFNGTTNSLTNYIVISSGPAITAQPTNLSVIESGTANFSVTAINPLAFQWQFNGTNISGATNSALIVSPVQMSAAGNYSVVVSNGLGTTLSSNALLTVLPLVTITNVVVMPRPSSATITWDTTTNATGQAAFGFDTNYGSIAPEGTALVSHHGALLLGLQPGTNYNFQLISSNGPYFGTYAGSFSTDVSLIIPAGQATYSGIWTVTSGATDKYSQFYEYTSTSSSSSTAQAVFRPTIITPALYDVYMWYPEGSNRSTTAPVTVGYNGGSTSVNLNQTTNGGSWQLLAAGVNFAAGTNGYVRLSNFSGENSKVVIADAVRFVYSAGQDAVMNNTPPPWWTAFYFGTSAVNVAADADGDGYSTLAEYIAGTDPNNPFSHLQVNGQAMASGGIQITFSPCFPDRHYQLQSRPGLIGGVWTNLPFSPVTINTNGQGVLTVTNLTGSQMSLRLSVGMAP